MVARSVYGGNEIMLSLLNSRGNVDVNIAPPPLGFFIGAVDTFSPILDNKILVKDAIPHHIARVPLIYFITEDMYVKNTSIENDQYIPEDEEYYIGSESWRQSSDNPYVYGRHFDTNKIFIVLNDTEFVKPVSPPGYNIALKSSEYNCDNLVLSQEFQIQDQTLKVNEMSLKDFQNYIQNGDLSCIYNVTHTLRTINRNMFDQVRVIILLRMVDFDTTSFDSILMSTYIVNTITEDVEWLQNVAMKSSVVELYGSLEEYLGNSYRDISLETLIDITRKLAGGISNIMNSFIEEHDKGNSVDATVSTQMSYMMKKMMMSLDGICNTALMKLPKSGTQTILFSSTWTTLLVQKVNSSTIAGSKLIVPSQDTWFEFPSSMKLNDSEDLRIQIIFQKRNPYIWESSIFNITSPVMTVEIKDERGLKLDMNEMHKPIKYVTPDPQEDVFHFSSINISYIKTNNSMVIPELSEMLLLNFTMKPFETRVIDVLLPGNISNIMVYGQAVEPPDHQTVLEKGLIYPADWAKMQAVYGISSDTPSENKMTGFKLNIQTNESILNGSSSYNMYFGIALDFGNDIKFEEGRDVDAECVKQTEHVFICSAAISFGIQVRSLFCVFWDDATTEWSSQGCLVHPGPDSRQLECYCNHLTDFSSRFVLQDFFVKPVPLVFSDILLFATVFENPVVVTVVIIVWVIYVFLLHWARRVDKQDQEKIGVLNCEDNSPTEMYIYIVCVITGWWSQAGTTANVYMHIKGVNGISSKKRLSTSARQCFQSGYEDWFVFTTEESLGFLETVTIWHDNAGTSPHWYLNQIYIKDVQTEDSWNFIYDDWLALDRGALLTVTTTVQAFSEEDLKFEQKYNFIMISSRNMRESHLWVSVLSKPPQSTFTRVQRLTCGLSLLLTMMLTNIMFYGLPSENPDDELQAGGFSFSLKQFIIGIESSLIMFPINLIVLQLFIRIKAKPSKEKKISVDDKMKEKKGTFIEEQELKFNHMLYRKGVFRQIKLYQKICSCYNEDTRGENGDKIVAEFLYSFSKRVFLKAYNQSGRLNSKSKVLSKKEIFPQCQDQFHQSTSTCDLKKGPVLKNRGVKKFLPWWFIYISWTIVMMSCLICSYCVMLYGLKYGYTRSTEWVVSFLTGFFQGVFFEQPVKVIGTAVIVALILHRQADIEEYGPDVELEQDEEYLNDVKTDVYIHQPFVEPISRSLRELIKKRLRLEWLMDHVIRDLILYVIYLAVVLLLLHGHTNNTVAFTNTQTVEKLLVGPGDGPSVMKVTTPEDFYSYMQETFVPVADDLMESQRDEVSSAANHYLLGYYRIRQLRVKKSKCPASLPHRYVTRRCVDEYWIGSEDTQNYAGSWSNRTRDVGTGPWSYQSSWNLKTLPYIGSHAAYSGGGYVQMLRHSTMGKIIGLKDKGWIDDHTRAVFVEGNLYNPNVDLFTLVTLLFEITPVGHVYPKHEILSMNLHHSSSDFKSLISTCEGLFVFFNIFFLVLEYRRFKNVGKKEYFSDIWNLFELLQIALSFVTVGLFFKREITVSDILQYYNENNKAQFINFYEAFFWNYVLTYIMATIGTFVVMKAAKLLRFNARTKLISATLAKVRPSLTGLLFLFLIVSIAYMLCGFLYFGRMMTAYRNWQHSFYSNTLMIFGNAIGQDIKDASPIFGPLYIYSFVFLLSYVFVQFFVSVVNTGRVITKFEIAGKNKFEIVDYVMAKARLLAGQK